MNEELKLTISDYLRHHLSVDVSSGESGTVVVTLYLKNDEGHKEVVSYSYCRIQK